MQRRDIFGIFFGVVGMLFCLFGMCCGIFALGPGLDSEAGEGLIFKKMISLQLGATLLFISALLAGPTARMYQILEGATIFFGMIYFIANKHNESFSSKDKITLKGNK